MVPWTFPIKSIPPTEGEPRSMELTLTLRLSAIGVLLTDYGFGFRGHHTYLILVDYTGQLFRDGKAAISAELTGILERLGSSAESWQARLEKLRGGRLLGRFFAASRERLREVATRLGCTTWQTSADARCDKKHLKSGIRSRA